MIFLLVWLGACVLFFGITALLDSDERVKKDDKEKSVRTKQQKQVSQVKRDTEQEKIDREKIIQCESYPEYVQYYRHR